MKGIDGAQSGGQVKARHEAGRRSQFLLLPFLLFFFAKNLPPLLIFGMKKSNANENREDEAELRRCLGVFIGLCVCAAKKIYTHVDTWEFKKKKAHKRQSFTRVCVV